MGDIIVLPVHVHVMTAQIQSNKHQKYSHPLRIDVPQISCQSSSRRSIRDHIEHGPKLAALVQESSGMAVEGVKEAGSSVEGQEEDRNV